MIIRKDSKSGKLYTYRNIPFDRLNSIQNENGFFVIYESNDKHPDDSWYEKIKVCGEYAVFKWVNTTPSTGFYQQVSPWYINYGNAINKMIKLAKGE